MAESENAIADGFGDGADGGEIDIAASAAAPPAPNRAPAWRRFGCIGRSATTAGLQGVSP